MIMEDKIRYEFVEKIQRLKYINLNVLKGAFKIVCKELDIPENEENWEIAKQAAKDFYKP
jgi:hypothetical protein